MGRTLRLTPIALVTLVLAVACGSGSGAPRAAALPGGEPAFQRVLDRVGDDGSIDRDTALAAFAVAFTTPPGVSRPPGPSEPVASGSGPLRWVVGHLGELTPDQRRAVLAVVPPPPRPTAALPAGPSLLATTEQGRFNALVGEAWAYWSRTYPPAALLHPTQLWSLTLNSTNQFAARAYTYPVNANGGTSGPMADCEIYVNPVLRTGTAEQQREAIYHEVFHCFQGQMVPDLAGYYGVADRGGQPGPGSWLIEGGAAYAMEVAVAGGPIGAEFWRRYFATPARPLFKRTYDGIGFFAHLAESGVDVMPRMPAALQAMVAHGSAAAFAALFAGGSPDRFFATWPAGLLRRPALGPDWDAHGPGITADAVTPGTVVVDSGSAPAGGQVPAYANDDRSLAISSDVLVLNARGYSRLRAAGGTLDSSTPSGVYCTMGASCACPSGSPQAGVAFQTLNRGSYYLAMSGGPGGSAWSVTPFSLSRFCSQPAVDACLPGTWRLTALPALPLPPSVTIQRADETLAITGTGAATLDVDVVDAVRISGGPPATGEVKGRATLRLLAIGGSLQPLDADFSGLLATASVPGITVNLTVAQVAPNLAAELTPVAYRCAGSTLFLTNRDGTQFVFARA
jgi:hypothetical protein